MIGPTGYRVRCDEGGSWTGTCDRELRHENRFQLQDDMQTAGWQRYVKLDGERAARGGKDYCPEHRKPSPATEGAPLHPAVTAHEAVTGV